MNNMADRLLLGLICAGNKASTIAQLCREEIALFSILIQEKGRLKNERLDFKTLADVFIQQVAKSELSAQIPGISDRVYGEENNQFTNALGDTITVEVKPSEEDTARLLSKVLDGNETAAKLLAECAHSSVSCSIVNDNEISDLTQCGLDVNQIGIWIDPIDGTNQYVKGIEDSVPSKQKIYPFGLQCVTVLLGAYDLSSGLPVMGVVFQPFHKKIGRHWESKCYWGVCYNGLRIGNTAQQCMANQSSRDKGLPVVIASTSDNVSCSAISTETALQLCHGSGAGYKCLCVIEGLADAFLYSDDACYKWDTCATHALLLSHGGGIACLKDVLAGDVNLDDVQIHYNKANKQPHSPWANIGGFIAYNSSRTSEQCIEIIKAMKLL